MGVVLVLELAGISPTTLALFRCRPSALGLAPIHGKLYNCSSGGRKGEKGALELRPTVPRYSGVDGEGMPLLLNLPGCPASRWDPFGGASGLEPAAAFPVLGNGRLLDLRARLHLALLARLVVHARPSGAPAASDSHPSTQAGGASRSAAGTQGGAAAGTQAGSQAGAPAGGGGNVVGASGWVPPDASAGSAAGGSGPWEWLVSTLAAAIAADEATAAALLRAQRGGGGASAAGGASVGGCGAGSGGRRGAGSRSARGYRPPSTPLRCLPLVQLTAAVLEIFPAGEAWLGAGRGGPSDRARPKTAKWHRSCLAEVVRIMGRLIVELGAHSALGLHDGFGSAAQLWGLLALSRAAHAARVALADGATDSSAAALRLEFAAVWGHLVDERLPYWRATSVRCQRFLYFQPSGE